MCTPCYELPDVGAGNWTSVLSSHVWEQTASIKSEDCPSYCGLSAYLIQHSHLVLVGVFKAEVLQFPQPLPFAIHCAELELQDL